jgi:hypothetical protein
MLSVGHAGKKRENERKREMGYSNDTRWPTKNKEAVTHKMDHTHTRWITHDLAT